MTRLPLPPAFHRIRRLPRGFVLGTVVLGGTLSWNQDVFAQGGLPSLFRKAQPSSGAKSADAVPEIRKLLADARVAASQRDYSTAIRLAERAEKLAADTPATIGAAPDCAPAQIATVLQQYRQARAGRDVRMSLDTSPRLNLPGKPAPQAIRPVVRPPVATAADRTPAADTRPGTTVAPVEKLLAQRSRPEPSSARPPAAPLTQPVAPPAARPEPKLATEFRPTTAAARNNASIVEIRNHQAEPLAARSSFFSESLIRTTGPLKSAPAGPIDPARVARIPDVPRPPQDAVDAEIAAMDAGSLVASQAAASTNSAIDPALRERLLQPLGGMRVRFQDASPAATAIVDTSDEPVADEEITVVVTEPTIAVQPVAAADPAMIAEPAIAETLTAEAPAAEPELQTALAADEQPESPEFPAASFGIETLAPVYDIQTAQAVAEPAPDVRQVSDEQPVPQSSSPRTFHSSTVVRHLEWSPVARPTAPAVVEREPESEPAPPSPEPLERDTTLKFEEPATESENQAGVEQAGFRGEDAWTAADRGASPRHRNIDEEVTGPFVVFREPEVAVSPAWEVAPPPPTDNVSGAVSEIRHKTGLPRDALWWFSAAGILLGALGLSSLLPRQK